MKCEYCKQEIKGKEAYWKTKVSCNECFARNKFGSLELQKNSPLTRKMSIIAKRTGLRKSRNHYNLLIQEFFRLESEKDKYTNTRTWRQFIILKKAMEIGKRINSFYGIITLSNDFRISMKHCKRLLSLSNCTQRTKKLIREGKISANKVAIITFEKPLSMQKEIIDWAIFNKSTNIEIHEYRTLNPNSRNGILNDYNRLNNKINEIFNFIHKIPKDFPDNYKLKIKPKLEELKSEIELCLNQL